MSEYKAEPMNASPKTAPRTNYLRRKGTDLVFCWTENLAKNHDMESVTDDEAKASVARKEATDRSRAVSKKTPEPTFDNAREAIDHYSGKTKEDANTEAVRALNAVNFLNEQKEPKLDPPPSALQTVIDTSAQEERDYKEAVAERVMNGPEPGVDAPWEPHVTPEVKKLIYDMTKPMLERLGNLKGLRFKDGTSIDIVRARVLKKLEIENNATKEADKADQARQIEQSLVALETTP